MTNEDLERRLAHAEAQLDSLAKDRTPAPKPLWKRLPTLETIRNIIYLIGLPVTVVLAYQAFDREILNAQKTRDLAQKDTAIERLDQLQDINTEIYRLQTQGDNDTAFAIIEAKRGRIARLTDTVYSSWKDLPDMLGRYDLNALAEALLVQGRTGDAFEVSSTVDTTALGPIDQIDQLILNARIQFALGPAHDMEAARESLRAATPLLEQIERKGQMLLMLEKIAVIRLSNEYWRNTDCEKLLQIAAGLREVNAENMAAGAYRDRFGVDITLEGVKHKCGG